MTYDFVIVGAGISGLTTAIVLSKQGLKVAVVEKSQKTMPLIRGFKRNGYLFDTGFHYSGGLAEGGILRTFFRYLGMEKNIETEPLNNKAFDVFHCTGNGSAFSFPVGYENIKTALVSAFPREDTAIDAYLDMVRSVPSGLPYINLDAPLLGYKWAAQGQSVSVKDFLDGLTKDSLLKSVLSMHCLLHGISANEVSCFTHSCIVAPYYESACRIVGGGEQLAKAFDDCLAKCEIDLFCGRGAQSLSFTSSGVFELVMLEDGQKVQARDCVVALHPHQMLRMVPSSFFRPIYRKRLESLRETPSAYLVYGFVERPRENLDDSNHFFFSEEGYPDLGWKTPLGSRPMYVTRAGKVRDGKTAFLAMSPSSIEEMTEWADSRTGNRTESYRVHKQSVIDVFVDRLAAFDPSFKNCDGLGCATPLTFRDWSNSPFGSLYGTKHSMDHYDPMPATRLRNLFLSGQAVAAPGILGAMVSAFLTCGNILGHETLREELRKCRNKG